MAVVLILKELAAEIAVTAVHMATNVIPKGMRA